MVQTKIPSRRSEPKIEGAGRNHKKYPPGKIIVCKRSVKNFKLKWVQTKIPSHLSELKTEGAGSNHKK